MTTPPTRWLGPAPALGLAAVVALLALLAVGFCARGQTAAEPVPAALRVQIEGGRAFGQPELRWATAAAPTWLFARLSSAAPDAAVAVPHAEPLRVPAGHWTLLRAGARGAAAPVAFRMVPPFQGTRIERIELSGRRAIHAVLLESDWRTPAAGRAVRLYASDLRRMQMPEETAVRATDVHGMVTFEGLPDGGFLLCAPGAMPGDAVPHAVRIDFARGSGPNEQPCTLVTPAARRPVLLEVQADFERKAGVSPKLCFARKDDGSGAFFEQPAILQPGAQTVELALPAGRYRVFVLPLGELLVDPRDEMLDVAADVAAGGEVGAGGGAGAARPLVRARQNPAFAEVELEGLEQQDLPIRVYPQPIGEILDDRPDKMWWGPYRWHVATMSVPSIEGPRRLCAFGRTRSFVSARAVTIDAGLKLSVEMVPASVLTVRWCDWDPARDRDATVFVDAGDEAPTDDGVARTLAPALDAGALRPALTGTLSVPRGARALQVECRRADGTLAWRRTVHADAPEVVVDPGGQRP